MGSNPVGSNFVSCCQQMLNGCCGITPISNISNKALYSGISHTGQSVREARYFVFPLPADSYSGRLSYRQFFVDMRVIHTDEFDTGQLGQYESHLSLIPANRTAGMRSTTVLC